MPDKKDIKEYLHPRSLHRGPYDYELLTKHYPALKPFIIKNKKNLSSINYADSEAVTALNTALLFTHYDLSYWEIPDNFLCPAVPGRAEYLHHMADILSQFADRIPRGPKLKVLDLGVGANCIYPIIGRKVYKWSFIGTDINLQSLKAAQKIINKNSLLKGHVELRHQKEPQKLISNLIKPDEYLDLVICNPPFFSSAKEARQASLKKSYALTNSKMRSAQKARNFGGQHSELWCNGGELDFVRRLIQDSQLLASRCLVFSSLISNSKHLPKLKAELANASTLYQEIIPLRLGNKKSHLIVWSYLKPKQMKIWAAARWVTPSR